MSRKFTTFVRGGLILCLSILVSVSVHAQRPLGTDVSGWQTNVNWTTVKNAGVVFAWTKATQGTDFNNPYFTSQEAGAKSAGIYIGAYHYATPSVDTNITGAFSADSEAAYFWSVASNYVKSGGGYLVPALDWEDTDVLNNPNLTTAKLSQWLNEWCNDVSNYAAASGVIGVRPVVYTSAWYSEPGEYPGLNNTVTNWPDWISGYTGTNTQTGGPSGLTYPWPSWNIWQYWDTNWSGGDSDVYNGNSLTNFLQTFGVGDQLPTAFNWIASSPADYSVAADWSPSGVPNGASIVVNFTNNVTCNYSAGDNHSLSQMFLGPLDNSTGKFSMGGGTLSITNGAGAYSLILGGNGGSLTTTTGANSVGTFTMSGGTLNVVRNSNTNLYQDSFMLGLGTNSTGTFTLNGGTANFLCGIEIGINGPGILNVNGGLLIDNSWFHVGSGASKAGGMGSGTFNLTSGTVYILPNIYTPSTEAANNGGLAINQAVTNAVVNISGGTLYCYRIGLDGNTGIPSTGSTDTLNISGGLIYVGAGGVGTNNAGNASSQVQSVNISGGTFHTADILPSGGGGGVNGSTNNVLTDGTNWVWGVNPPANLTNSIPGMGGVGYVTFAPEANCTISLKNVWSGQGGINVAGPGQVKLAGTNTYTGNTTVSGGELSLTGGGAIGTSPEIIVAGGATFDVSGLLNTNIVAGFTNIFLLASGQTLIGSGTVNGTLSAGSGATIAPGSSTAIGTLTNTGSTLLQGGGTFTVKVQNATTGAGVGNDNLAVSGNIGVLATTGNTFTVKLVSLKGTGAAGNVTNFNNTVSHTWTIATGTATNFNAGAFTVDASGFSNPLGGGQFFASNLGNSLVLYFDPAGTAGGMGGSISNPGMNGNRNPTFSGFGIPGYTYGVESETNLITGPWIEAGTVMAGTNNGSWSFTDTNQNNPPMIYYRLYYPDNPGNPPP